MSDAASQREQQLQLTQLWGSRGKALLQDPRGALIVVREEPDRELLASGALG